MVRARSRALVEGDRRDRWQDPIIGRPSRRYWGRRPERSDAWIGISRRVWTGRQARSFVERPADPRRMQRNRIQGWGARSTGQTGRQSGSHGVHRAQDPLAQKPRASSFRPCSPGAPAQGLHPMEIDRDLRDRGQRRFGDPATRRRQPSLERRAALEASTRSVAPASLL